MDVAYGRWAKGETCYPHKWAALNCPVGSTKHFVLCLIKILMLPAKGPTSSFFFVPSELVQCKDMSLLSCILCSFPSLLFFGRGPCDFFQHNWVLIKGVFFFLDTCDIFIPGFIEIQILKQNECKWIRTLLPNNTVLIYNRNRFYLAEHYISA